MSSVCIALFVIFAILLCVFSLKTFSFWSTRGIPCVKPLLPVIGNVYDVFLLRPAIDIISRMYNSLDVPFCGFYVFAKPVLMIREPDLIKKICVAHFNYFVDRGFQSNPDVDPLAKNIIHLKGHDWKIIRPKITTCFNVNKVKKMWTVMDESAMEVMELFHTQYERGVDCEFLDVSCRFTIDCIMKTLFGVNSNCVRDPDAEFRVAGKEVLGVQFIKHVFIGIFSPWLHSCFGVTMCSSKSTELFMRVVCDNVKFRTGVGSHGNDFFQTLMRMKEEYETARKADLTVEGPVIDDDFIAGQVFMFFTAGFETPANTLAFCMYELTQHKYIQENIYQEIKTVLERHNDQVTYEAIQDMKYLNQVVSETMRKYPPLSLIFRQCTKDYQIPDTVITIEAGTLVLIPTYGIHYDPKYYAEPQLFDPERFNEENLAQLNTGAYLPFGIGPRNCPAILFANIMMKILLVRILQSYEVSLSEKTKVPLGFNPLQFVLTPQKSGVWLKLEKRK